MLDVLRIRKVLPLHFVKLIVKQALDHQMVHAKWIFQYTLAVINYTIWQKHNVILLLYRNIDIFKVP